MDYFEVEEDVFVEKDDHLSYGEFFKALYDSGLYIRYYDSIKDSDRGNDIVLVDGDSRTVLNGTVDEAGIEKPIPCKIRDGLRFANHFDIDIEIVKHSDQSVIARYMLIQGYDEDVWIRDKSLEGRMVYKTIRYR